MKKTWLTLALMLMGSTCFAEPTKTILNPYTGKFDFITSLTDVGIATGTIASNLLASTNTWTAVQHGNFLSISSGTVTYDGNGYVTQQTIGSGIVMTYTYDANNLLTSKTDGTRTWTYTYDGSNILQNWSVSP